MHEFDNAFYRPMHDNIMISLLGNGFPWVLLMWLT